MPPVAGHYSPSQQRIALPIWSVIGNSMRMHRYRLPAIPRATILTQRSDDLPSACLAFGTGHSTSMETTTESSSPTIRRWLWTSIPFPCGFTQSATTRVGPGFSVGATQGTMPFGWGTRITLVLPLFIIGSWKEPTRIKALLITFFPVGTSGTISFARTEGSVRLPGLT